MNKVGSHADGNLGTVTSVSFVGENGWIVKRETQNSRVCTYSGWNCPLFVLKSFMGDAYGTGGCEGTDSMTLGDYGALPRMSD